MPLGPFFATVNYVFWFPWLHHRTSYFKPTMPLCPFLLYSKPRAFVSIVTSTMLTYHNPLLSKTEWWRYCVHLRNLNFRHFLMVEATGLKKMALRLPSVSSPQYISSKSTNQFLSCTHLRSLNVHHFGMVEAMWLKYGIGVTFSVISSAQNFIQIYYSVQKLLGGFLCTHIKSLNMSFGNGWSFGLENVASRSSSVTLPPYQM
jgi:hypothetical protein